MTSSGHRILVVDDEEMIRDSIVEFLDENGYQAMGAADGQEALDKLAAPKASCTTNSYAVDPDAHQWCCRPHVAAEGEWADTIAERRAKGELNPEVWPPVVDEERFDPADGNDPVASTDAGPVPDDLTPDDLD